MTRRAADDYEAIARMLRELEGHKAKERDNAPEPETSADRKSEIPAMYESSLGFVDYDNYDPA